jgi:hypothetical protein
MAGDWQIRLLKKSGILTFKELGSNSLAQLCEMPVARSQLLIA